MLELGEGMAMINNDVAHFTAQEMMADVRWSNNPTLPTFSGTFNDFVKLSTSDNRYDCIGYTSATLAVSFEGKSVSWRALYLTGCPKGTLQSGLTTTVQAIDFVMSDGVPAFLN